MRRELGIYALCVMHDYTVRLYVSWQVTDFTTRQHAAVAVRARWEQGPMQLFPPRPPSYFSLVHSGSDSVSNHGSYSASTVV